MTAKRRRGAARLERLAHWLETGSFALGIVAEGMAQLRGRRRRSHGRPGAPPAFESPARTAKVIPARRRPGRPKAGSRPAPRRRPRRRGPRPEGPR